MKHIMKNRIEKSALQTFQEVVLNENEGNQNVVSQKNAQALAMLLKSARKKHNKQEGKVNK